MLWFISSIHFILSRYPSAEPRVTSKLMDREDFLKEACLNASLEDRGSCSNLVSSNFWRSRPFQAHTWLSLSRCFLVTLGGTNCRADMDVSSSLTVVSETDGLDLISESSTSPCVGLDRSSTFRFGGILDGPCLFDFSSDVDTRRRWLSDWA